MAVLGQGVVLARPDVLPVVAIAWMASSISRMSGVLGLAVVGEPVRGRSRWKMPNSTLGSPGVSRMCVRRPVRNKRVPLYGRTGRISNDRLESVTRVGGAGRSVLQELEPDPLGGSSSIRSMTVADAMPPAAHAHGHRADGARPVRSSSLSIVTIMRAPVQPDRVAEQNGQAVHVHTLPGQAQGLHHATVTGAEASLISHGVDIGDRHPPSQGRDGDRRGVPVSAGLSGAGAQPGCGPAGEPVGRRASLDTSTSAAAASLSPEELPAVVVAPSSSGFQQRQRRQLLGVEVQRAVLVDLEPRTVGEGDGGRSRS